MDVKDATELQMLALERWKYYCSYWKCSKRPLKLIWYPIFRAWNICKMVINCSSSCWWWTIWDSCRWKCS